MRREPETGGGPGTDGDDDESERAEAAEESRARPDGGDATCVEILVYEGFDELDAIGPYEVFRTANAFGGAVDARLVTLEPTEWVAASHGLRVGVDGVLSETPAAVVVPGGGWNAGDDRAGARREAERGAVPDALRELAGEGATLAAVCTGGMLLAAAGLLDGRPAVTHGGALADLEATAARVVDARVVDDGDVLTAGGITSGIDLSLHLVSRWCSPSLAERVATELEYPFDPSGVAVSGADDADE